MRSLIAVGLLLMVPSLAWAGEIPPPFRQRLLRSSPRLRSTRGTCAGCRRIRAMVRLRRSGSRSFSRRSRRSRKTRSRCTRRPLSIATHIECVESSTSIRELRNLAALGAELWLGQALYNTPSNADSLRGVHAAVGTGIVALASMNTVTGAWNLFGAEGRQDREGRTLVWCTACS